MGANFAEDLPSRPTRDRKNNDLTEVASAIGSRAGLPSLAKEGFFHFSLRSHMSSLQQRIAAIACTAANLLAQLRELDRLRGRVRKAQLTARRRRIDHRKRRRT
jgi:hypothetical protein